MNRACHLFLSCALVLVSFSGLSTPVHCSDELTRRFTTVTARREKLAQLLTERDQFQANGDRVAVVQLSNQITEMYLKLCEFDAALTESTRTLEIARTISGSGEAKLLVDTLTLAARIHIDRTESPTALILAADALRQSREHGYRSGEAQSLTRLAEAYFELDQRKDAASNNDRALEIWQQLQDKRGEAHALEMQGLLLMMDNRPEASDVFEAAEVLWREIGDPAPLADALVDQNFIAIRHGQWQIALGLLNEAQALLVEEEAEPYIAGKIANSFGEVYEAYGQLDTALSYFLESLSHFRDVARDVKGTITAGIKVARVQASLGNYHAATQQMDKSLAAAVLTNNALTIGLCHEDFGRVWLQAGSYELARVEFLNAISYFNKSDSARPIARANMYLGQTEHLMGNLARAGEAYETAMRFFAKVSDYTNEAAVRFGLGKLALLKKQLDEAELHLSRSIELTENLRENASSKELRSSFLHSVHDRYETYVEWLMTRYSRDRNPQDAIRAFEAAESGRARALLDSLYNYQRELRQPSEPALVLDEEKLQIEEQRLVDVKTRLLSRSTDEETADVDDQLREVRAKLESLEARIKSSAKFKDLLRPNPLRYERIRSDITDAQTSLLYYSLGSAKSFAWVVTTDGLNAFELADKKTIETAAHQLLNRLNTPPRTASEDTELQTAIGEVSRLVVEPLSANLKTQRLIVIADGILQYVPLGILETPSTARAPLISRFEIVEAPSASALALVRRERMGRQAASKLLIGFGDAVFSSEYSPQPTKVNPNSSEERSKQVASRFRNLPRLFYAKRELRAIGELAGDDSAFYIEHNATRDKLLSVDLSQYRILHVVTHGVLDDQRPELSGLVLSMVDENAAPVDGFVSLADIYKMRAPVDLVVLSACHTALGQNLRGEGLIGLTRGFMYAGASGIVASLWKVDDRATAELMRHFYSNMLQRGMAPAAALRAAQNEIRSQPKWSAPYYWAGFTFQGDYDLTIRFEPPAARFGYRQLIAAVGLVLLVAATAYWFVRYRRSRN